MDNTFTEPSSTSCLNVHGFSKLFDQSGCSFGCDLATSEFHECLVSQMDLYETERKRVLSMFDSQSDTTQLWILI